MGLGLVDEGVVEEVGRSNWRQGNAVVRPFLGICCYFILFRGRGIRVNMILLLDDMIGIVLLLHALADPATLGVLGHVLYLTFCLILCALLFRR